jgi:hypothetical protein
VVIQATKDFTVKTVQKAADLAVPAGSRLYTDSASSYRALNDIPHRGPDFGEFLSVKPYMPFAQELEEVLDTRRSD